MRYSIILNPTFPLPVKEMGSHSLSIRSYNSSFDCGFFDDVVQKSWDSGKGNSDTLLMANYDCRCQMVPPLIVVDG